MTDTTTFTDEKRRTEVEAWLYETCTQCLQHMVDVVVQFYPEVQPLLGRMLDLLASFIRRTHQSLAAVGVAALTRLLTSAGMRACPLLSQPLPLMRAARRVGGHSAGMYAWSTAGNQMSDTIWQEAITMLSHVVSDTRPQVLDLVAPAMRRASLPGNGEASPHRRARPDTTSDGRPLVMPGGTCCVVSLAGPGMLTEGWLGVQFSLSEGAGARRLTEVRSRAAVQLLLVQACGEIYSQFSGKLNQAATILMLDTLSGIASHAGDLDADVALRRTLARMQAEDHVSRLEQASPLRLCASLSVA